MTTLNISPEVQLPASTITGTNAILARKGSGKTYTAKKIAEEMYRIGAQIAVLDPIGVWFGLRSLADGSADGLPILILGGEHGDLDLSSESGKQIAAFLVESKQSVVLDVSEFSKNQQKRFVADFAEELYRLNKTPLHLILEEADEFAPQRPGDGEQRMLGAIDRIVRRGRSRGLGVTMITQRPAVLHKNVLSQADLLILMKLMANQDRTAVEAWVSAHADVDQLAAVKGSLAALGVGEAWFWSPPDLFVRTKVDRIATFDSSATPDFDLQSERVQPSLKDVDFSALTAMLKVDEEEAEGPKAVKGKSADVKPLQDQIERLKAQLADEKSSAYERGWNDALFAVKGAIGSVARPTQIEKSTALAVTPNIDPKKPLRAKREVAAPGEMHPKLVSIIEVLARFKSLGQLTIDKKVVAVMSGQSPKSSSYSGHLSALRQAGYISTDGGVSLTDEGAALAPPIAKATKLADYHREWRNVLSAAALPYFNVLSAESETLTKGQLAEKANRSRTSSSFSAAISELKSFGLIRTSGEWVDTTEVMFPKGLK